MEPDKKPPAPSIGWAETKRRCYQSIQARMIDIPKDKTFPVDSVQCNECGGTGCDDCMQRGWLVPADNPKGRRCERAECNKPLPPGHVAVYCSNECAFEDA